MPAVKLSNLQLSNDRLSLLVLGPGFGECVLVRIPPNDVLIVDSFLRPRTNSGVSPALEVIQRHRDKLSAVVLTHPHADHAEGFDRLVGECSGLVGCVEASYLPAAGPADAQAQLALSLTKSALSSIRTRWEKEPSSRWNLKANDSRAVGAATVTVLHPDQETIDTRRELNHLSAPLLIAWKNVRLVLGADLPTSLWPRVDGAHNIAVHQGLKLPHHASENGFHPQIHGGRGPRDRIWVATPDRLSPKPPRFEDGQGVDLCLRCVDEMILTSVLFELPEQREAAWTRHELLALANAKTVVPRVPGKSTATLIPEARDPEAAWVCASWNEDGSLSSLTKGGASVTIR